VKCGFGDRSAASSAPAADGPGAASATLTKTITHYRVHPNQPASLAVVSLARGVRDTVFFKTLEAAKDHYKNRSFVMGEQLSETMPVDVRQAFDDAVRLYSHWKSGRT
jgi:hypothetical protein